MSLAVLGASPALNPSAHSNEWGCGGGGCCPASQPSYLYLCVMQGVLCFDTHIYKQINSLNKRAGLVRPSLEWPKQ